MIELYGQIKPQRLRGHLNVVPSESGAGGPLQAKTVYPSHSEQIITPDEDYYGLVSVTVKPVPRIPACVVSVAEDSANVVETVVNIAAAISVESETITGIRLNYIRSTGTQYFDTGVVPDETTEIEMKYSVQNILQYGCHMLSSEKCYFPLPRSYLNKYCFFSSRLGNEVEAEYTPTVNTIYTVKAFPSNKIVINGTERATLVSGSSVDTSTLYMNTYGGDPGNVNYTGSATIYYCKIWKSGVLVRDFIPYKSFTDGVGMLDLVENKFYTSAGTGQFEAGSYNP